MKKEKIKKTKIEVEKEKSLITSRVLFISVLDKIFLVLLGILLILGTFNNFNGPIGSLSYGFLGRVGSYIIFLIEILIIYLILNWLYKCALKTMLCLTKNEVYKESFVPFKRKETSIPLNKITGVSSINLFWIIRCVVIHQYQKLPLIFFTWTNQEFKDKLNELITTDKNHVENDYENRNIINLEMVKYLKYVGILLVGVIALLGIVRFFMYTFNSERKLAGVYKYDNYIVELKKNGRCNLTGFNSNINKCTWVFNKDNREVKVIYEYDYNYGYYKGTSSDSITLKYNDDKSLDYRSMKFIK